MGSDSHTPGPWTVEQPWNGFSAVRGLNGELVFGLAAGSADEKQPDETCEANARLIAAAPCMKEALEAASHALRSYQYGNASTELAKAIADKCDAALSRATKGGEDL